MIHSIISLVFTFGVRRHDVGYVGLKASGVSVKAYDLNLEGKSALVVNTVGGSESF